EYMALGAAILANDVGQISDIAIDGKTAYLYENKNAVSLADAMQYLQEQPELRINLAKQGQEDFIKNHTWQARMKYLGDYFVTKEVANV
ncbi:MAG TPA: glycosyltransferase, partial [Trueperaceae bacterium]|nr:glycosyltransferase [Trueperaceae bacterium]